jgi:hypothetical protein
MDEFFRQINDSLGGIRATQFTAFLLHETERRTIPHEVPDSVGEFFTG